MNYKTRAITEDELKEIIQTMRIGGAGFRPNNRIAEALLLEANTGLRISDILQLTRGDFIKESGRYRLDIVEQKTGKARTFTIATPIYQELVFYCAENGIMGKDEIIFPITERQVQRYLRIVCDYLGLEGVSTHSFRKFFATSIYMESGCNIELVRTLLQHSSSAVTQRYIGIQPKEVEEALKRHAVLI